MATIEKEKICQTVEERLQETDAEIEGLVDNNSLKTRSVNDFQTNHCLKLATWEKVKKSLSNRLSDAIQSQFNLSPDDCFELESKLRKLETQNITLQQENQQLSSQIELIRNKMALLEDERSRDIYSAENLKQSHLREIAKLKEQKENLASDLLKCLDRLESQKRKVHELSEEVKSRGISSDSSRCSHSSSDISYNNSSTMVQNWQHGGSDDSLANQSTASGYKSTSSLLKNLQTQLKQKESDICQLKSELVKMERARESLLRELVDLSGQNEKLEFEARKLKSLEEEYKALEQKYDILLQMYGEKVKEAEELQLDLSNIRSNFKAKVEELFGKM